MKVNYLLYISLIVIFCIIPLFAQDEVVEEETELSEDEVIIEIEGESLSEDVSEEETEDVKEKEVKIIVKKEHEGDDDIVNVGHEDILVEKGEVIDGNIVKVHGNITIYGEVLGDVVCIRGKLKVGPEAHITGDVVLIGGTYDISPSAKIDGEKTILDITLPFGLKLGELISSFQDSLISRVFQLFKIIGWLIVWILIGMAMIAFAPKNYDIIRDCYEKDFLITSLAGLITSVVVPVLSIILIFTIIGIPFIFVLYIVFFVSGFIGLSALASIIAERLFPKLKDNRYLSTIVGILILDSIMIIGRLLALPGGWFNVIGEVMSVVGGSLVAVGFIMGVGSIVLTMFGKKPRMIKPVEEE
jgi:hypothetical protein